MDKLAHDNCKKLLQAVDGCRFNMMLNVGVVIASYKIEFEIKIVLQFELKRVHWIGVFSS